MDGPPELIEWLVRNEVGLVASVGAGDLEQSDERRCESDEPELHGWAS